MPNFITIPIKVRALVLDHDQMTTSPLANFSKLPWTDGFNDYNYSQPFIADGIVHHPFSDTNERLMKGIHLHFILPHFLGQQVPEKAGSSFTNQIPPAPNKWVVYNGTDTWVIESDYIHHQSDTPTAPVAIIPFPSNAEKPGPPYRYMGRQTKLAEGRPAGNTFKSLSQKSLTAAGYGDLKFSSFYPNCKGVFGFFDSNNTFNGTYQVIGWNDSETDDVLIDSIGSYLSTNKNANGEEVQEFIKNTFKVDVGEGVTSSGYRTLYHGQITINGSAPEADTSNIKIGVGNTGTEAISAFAANNQSEGHPNTKLLIEEQLESILLHHKLDHLLTDTGPKFLEARHEKGFKSSHSGHIWKIISEDQARTSDSKPTEDPLPELPVTLAKQLHELNKAQLNYDKAHHTIITLRKQLYNDWYKYMVSSYPLEGERGHYPDLERIRYFIDNYSVKELEDLVNSTGLASFKTGHIPTTDSTNSSSLANLLINAWETANATLETENTKRHAANQPSLALSFISGPRFWEPTSPVILISGLDIASSDEFVPNIENKPRYITADLVSSTLNVKLFNTSNNVGNIFSQCSALNQTKITDQHWNPFLLDWKVSLVNSEAKNESGRFYSDSLKSNFGLQNYSPYLKRFNHVDGQEMEFSGTSIMSTQTRPAVLAQLYKFISEYIDKSGITFKGSYTLSDFLKQSTYTDASSMLTIPTGVDSAASSPLFSAQSTYYWLTKNKVITQALNGFNNASLMLHQVAQLPIEEPLGFIEGQEFTKVVRELVQGYKSASPLLGFDFNPIRSGDLTFDKLRLIDNFGLWKDLDNANIGTPVVSEPLTGDSGNLFLPPRLVQAARLNFRWMSAHSISEEENVYLDQENAAETNDHPLTSPVCGWLMANYFNNSTGNAHTIAGESNILGVYDAFGVAIGYLDHNAEWNLMPWIDGACDIDVNIENEYLRNLVRWLMNTFTSGFSDFITATKEGLDNVAPHNQNLFNVKSILMGRPMAVVRSRVSFQVKGNPAISQSWPSFLADLEHSDGKSDYGYDERNNDDWTTVKLPVRIGEHHQLNDGVVAYWPEDSNGNLTNLYTPETAASSVSTNNSIHAFDGNTVRELWLSPEDDPLNIMLLMDPRGVAHATTGVLPTKSINIPPEFYLDAMNNLNMWFGISPLIQPQGESLIQNLPKISGYQWEWWDKNNGMCPVLPDTEKITNTTNNQILEGWLRLVPNN